MNLLSNTGNKIDASLDDVINRLNSLRENDKNFVVLISDKEMIQVINSKAKIYFRHQNDRARIMRSSEQFRSHEDLIEVFTQFYKGSQGWDKGIVFKKEYFPGVRGLIERMADKIRGS
ncbi:hypothetical protein P886_2360 [Alteromonadaceae bacterium 2753L.S.0a.02]|nr:hypothetical protein P886_2360 [Alteromonadaceae bacterium 2753L.S.0a.02]